MGKLGKKHTFLLSVFLINYQISLFFGCIYRESYTDVLNEDFVFLLAVWGMGGLVLQAGTYMTEIAIINFIYMN